MKKVASRNPRKLRELAAWYRELAERTGNPWTWDARLQTAKNLGREAAMLDNRDEQGI
jgi:hypothetical protein